MAAAFQSSTSDQVAADLDTDLVVTKPVGLAAGDLMVAVAGCGDNRTIAPPAGWTTVEDSTDGLYRFAVFTRIATAGDVAASNFTFTVNGTFSAASIGLLRISGAIDTGIITAYATGPNDTSITCANVTTAVNGSLVIWGAYQGGANSGPASIPGPSVERIDIGNAFGGWYYAATEDRATAGLATGPVITKTGFSASRGFSIAIRPSGGTPSGGGLSLAGRLLGKLQY